MSNPSPRYIEAVATALQTGSYQWSDGTTTIQYGDGKWGNLAATAAAILLDREATSPVLNAAPSYGSLKEPLVKVVSFMRNMDYTRTSYAKHDDTTLKTGLYDQIGQMVYEAPSVFNFFAPIFSPPGAFSQTGLLAPEAQVLSTITVVGIVNGLHSLVKRGLNNCWEGPGFGSFGGCDYAVGYLNFVPTSDVSNGALVVDELSTLITSGRLSKASRELIAEQYNTVYASDGAEIALRMAQQMLVTTPEFHSTNVVRPTGENRTADAASGTTDEPYKAIVHLYLFGGIDSFYMLAPHTSCGDLYTGTCLIHCCRFQIACSSLIIPNWFL